MCVTFPMISHTHADPPAVVLTSVTSPSPSELAVYEAPHIMHSPLT